MDMTSIAAAASSLKAAADIAKALGELKSASDIQAKVIDLQREILSAQSSALAAQSDQFAMTERVRELEKEVARVKAWDEMKKRYSLHEPSPGTFVYALDNASKGHEPSHWICSKCYEDGVRSILQLKTKGMEHDHYHCPNCKTDVKARGSRPRPMVDPESGRW